MLEAERIECVLEGARGVDWSVSVRDVGSGNPLVSVAAEENRPIASVGKLLLLAEVARQISEGGLSPSEPVRRLPDDLVTDSGIWQHLITDELPVADLAALVGAVSDNLATNVLLRVIGLDSIDHRGVGQSYPGIRLLDRVRDERTTSNPPTLAIGTATELSRFMADLMTGKVVSESASKMILDWLALSADHSMIAGAFFLDPLSHISSDHGVRLRNKTGTDFGVRADVGLVVPEDGAALTYAVLAEWNPEGPDLRDSALTCMRAIGSVLRESVL